MNGNLHSNLPGCAIAAARIQDRADFPVHRLTDELIDTANKLKTDRRQQYLTGRILLAELLFQTYGIHQLPEIITGPNGRPSFSEPGLPDFNISHSDDYIMVALAQNCQVGLDLEFMRARKRLIDLAQYSFSETEYEWFIQLPQEQQQDAFWQLWTIRESILKLSGKGVWQMKEMKINPQSRRLFAQFNDRLNCWSCRQEPLFWAITTDVAVDKSRISLWRASEDLTSLLLQPLPELTLFSST